MPKIAILSDIHGNLPALVAVLREIAKSSAERLVVAGDIIGYGANSRECVELVQKVSAQVVFGNHESYARLIQQEGPAALEPDWRSSPVYAGIVHALGQLNGDQLKWLRGLPWAQRIAPAAVMAHATLHDPELWQYLFSAEDARPTFDVMRDKGIELAFFGHTHRQAWFSDPEAQGQPEQVDDEHLHLPEGSICAVTAGAVGQPRGDDGDPRATWVLWDTETRIIEFRKTSYAVDRAARAIREAGLPEESANRLFPAMDFTS